MPEFTLVPSEVLNAAIEAKLRLPVNAAQLYYVDSLNLTPAVQSRIHDFIISQNIAGGASLQIVPALAFNYFVINMAYMMCTTAVEGQIISGATVLLDYPLQANQPVLFNFQPNGLFNGNNNAAINAKNPTGGAAVFSMGVWGNYLAI